MNLLFDLIATQPNTSHKFHGGGKYTKQVYLCLLKYNNFRVSIFAVFDSKFDLDNEIVSCSKQLNIKLIDIHDYDLLTICKQYNIDRFYSGIIVQIENVTKLECEKIGTVHGLRGLELQTDFHSLLYTVGFIKKLKSFIKILMKAYFNKKLYKEFDDLLENIKIYTVSNHSKYAIMSFFPGINEKNINVYYAPDVTDTNNVKAKAKNSDENEYFLLVSGNRWLKNNIRTAIALDELFTERNYIKHKVIITGVRNSKIFLKHLKNKDRFIFYDYINDDFLFELYSGAYAFLYMTLNEGFGYPPLEAMRYSVPVISSPFTSLTEILSDAVLYANPYSTKEIKNRVLQLFNDTIYQKLGRDGFLRYNFIKEKQMIDLQLLVEDLVT